MRRAPVQRDYDDDYAPRRAPSSAPVWAMALAMIGVALAFGLWLAPDILRAPGGATGAVGGQAPPSAVSRVRAPVATPIPGLALDQADADRMVAEAVAAGDAAAQPVQALAPLPLSSAGRPLISLEQQQQMERSLALAAKEAAAAAVDAAYADADAALKAQRAAAYADAKSRAPDVSYQDAVDMLHRDPCHVPRADPHTCDKGLYKPTPVQ